MPHEAATQDKSGVALFIDIDGVLRESAEPASPTLKLLLSSLCAKIDGALALISAHRIAELDSVLAPHRFCCAGLHGCETRDTAGHTWRQPIEPRTFDHARAILSQLIERHPGLLLEDTGCGLVLNFEHEPDLRVLAGTAVKSAADVLGRKFRLRKGKNKYDIHPAPPTHATAIATFMQQAPFRGRTPVCIGDEATDHDAFALVSGFRGFSVRVGANAPTGEAYSITALLDALRWLEETPSLSPPHDSCQCGWNPRDF